jgi:long-chain acyl-CoA synthetase
MATTNWKLAATLPLHPVEKPPYTIEAAGYKPVEGETLPRRNPKAKDGPLTQPAEGVTTVWELLQYCVRSYGDRPAVAGRSHVKTHRETTKVTKLVDGEKKQIEKEWTFMELSAYKYWSFKEFEKLVRELGSGLRHLGFSDGDRVHVFAATRSVVGSALASLGMFVVCLLAIAACNGWPWHTVVPPRP